MSVYISFTHTKVHNHNVQLANVDAYEYIFKNNTTFTCLKSAGTNIIFLFQTENVNVRQPGHSNVML